MVPFFSIARAVLQVLSRSAALCRLKRISRRHCFLFFQRNQRYEINLF